jgi:hypothetical protein
MTRFYDVWGENPKAFQRTLRDVFSQCKTGLGGITFSVLGREGMGSADCSANNTRKRFPESMTDQEFKKSMWGNNG